MLFADFAARQRDDIEGEFAALFTLAFDLFAAMRAQPRQVVVEVREAPVQPVVLVREAGKVAELRELFLLGARQTEKMNSRAGRVYRVFQLLYQPGTRSASEPVRMRRPDAGVKGAATVTFG